MEQTGGHRAWFLCRVVIGAVLVIAGCATGKRGAPVVPTTTSATPPATPAATASRHYTTGSSHLRVRAYRDGPLARLGHNHVVTSTDIVGELDLAEPLAASRFMLRLPLESLQVDLAAERAAAGPDVDTPVPDDDRAGTRSNMLGAAPLDAERTPVVPG